MVNPFKEVVEMLQRLTHPASGVDGLHSLLLELGPMNTASIQARMGD